MYRNVMQNQVLTRGGSLTTILFNEELAHLTTQTQANSLRPKIKVNQMIHFNILHSHQALSTLYSLQSAAR